MAQHALRLDFTATWVNDSVSKNINFLDSSTGANYRFTKIKQYISAITLRKSGVDIWRDHQYHLIDFFGDKNSFVILNHPADDFDEICFSTGVDSLMQCMGVQSGALDPVNGMYWTWQSGYIHTKIEAEIEKNGKISPLELHLGGYRYPNSTIQRVSVKYAGQQHMQILFNLKPIVQLCGEKEWNRVMSPGNNALILSKAWAGQFPKKP